MLSEAQRREIGQHFVLGFHGYQISDDILELIQTHFVGSVILMKRNVQDVDQIQKLILDLQSLAKEADHEFPLLIGTDQENGLVSAFTSASTVSQFPGAMALAATGSVSLAQQIYCATGEQLRLLGVNWAYSPVADVNSDMRNPVIGVRSFGDDPAKVGEYVVAAAKGLISSNVAPSVKHFPGHGDTHVDSHLALPKIMKDLAQLNSNELLPFRMLLEQLEPRPADATIMIGHMALPLITGDNSPCSLSSQIVTDILREQMHFDGVVVTDCLEMDAIAEASCGGCGVEEGTVRALEAGSDVVMICHTMERQAGAIQKTCDALESGRIQLKDLQRSGHRIQEMKKRYLGSWDDTMRELQDAEFASKWANAKASAAGLIDGAYHQAITTIQSGVPGSLPLPSGFSSTTLLYIPESESLNKAVDDADGVLRSKSGEIRNTVGASFLALRDAISKRTQVRHVVYHKSATLDGQMDWSSKVLFVLRSANTASWQIERLKEAIVQADAHDIQVTILSCCTPYDLLGVPGMERFPCLATFEFTPTAFEAVVRVLFGETEATGTIPVKYR